MKEIQAKTRSVRELLSDTKYGIDYYQREYKWQTKQIVELVADLTTAFLEEYPPMVWSAHALRSRLAWTLQKPSWSPKTPIFAAATSVTATKTRSMRLYVPSMNATSRAGRPLRKSNG